MCLDFELSFAIVEYFAKKNLHGYFATSMKTRIHSIVKVLCCDRRERNLCLDDTTWECRRKKRIVAEKRKVGRICRWHRPAGIRLNFIIKRRSENSGHDTVHLIQTRSVIAWLLPARFNSRENTLPFSLAVDLCAAQHTAKPARDYWTRIESLGEERAGIRVDEFPGRGH